MPCCLIHTHTSLDPPSPSGFNFHLASEISESTYEIWTLEAGQSVVLSSDSHEEKFVVVGFRADRRIEVLLKRIDSPPANSPNIRLRRRQSLPKAQNPFVVEHLASLKKKVEFSCGARGNTEEFRFGQMKELLAYEKGESQKEEENLKQLKEELQMAGNQIETLAEKLRHAAHYDEIAKEQRTEKLSKSKESVRKLREKLGIAKGEADRLKEEKREWKESEQKLQTEIAQLKRKRTEELHANEKPKKMARIEPQATAEPPTSPHSAQTLPGGQQLNLISSDHMKDLHVQWKD